MRLMASTPAQSPRDSPATSSTCSASAAAAASFFHQHPRTGRREWTATTTRSSSLSFLRANVDKTRSPSPSLFFGTPTTLFRSRSCENLQGTTRGFSQIRRTVSSDADFFFFFANKDKDEDEEEEPTYQNKRRRSSCNDDVSSRQSDWEKMIEKHRFQNVNNTVMVESVGEEEGERGILKVEEEFGRVSDYCSAKRAFRSMVFMIRELQTHSMGLREILFYEDLQGILCRVQLDMQASFCWLFQKIFSSTPTLMLSVMLLLANFTVHSMAHSIPAVATATTSESQPGGSASNIIVEIQKKGKRGNNLTDERTRSCRDLLTTLQREMQISSSWERTVEEAKRLQAETRHESLMDRELLVQLVSPVTVEIESDEDYGEYSRLELMYLRAVKEDPCNALFLSNYAQFLYQVRHDHDRAEHYFKRTAEVKPADAEALSRYASFLWMAKNNLAAAEETYLQAIDADPGNSSHAASYAHFLWNTGGDDTCFPLEDDDARQDQGHHPHQ